MNKKKLHNVTNKVIRQIKLIWQKNLYGYKGDDFT